VLRKKRFLAYMRKRNYMNNKENHNTVMIPPPPIIGNATTTSKIDVYLTKHMTDHDMMILLPRTHFSPIEFKLLKEYFTLMSESLLLDMEQSKWLFFAERYKRSGAEYAQYVPFSNEDEFVLARIFNAVNLDRDGYISFAEFVQALSVAIHGTFEEKAQFSFRIYDANQDGKISRQEMITYVTQLHRLGILKISSRLQRKQTRGDKEQQQLERMASHNSMSQFKENLPKTVFGVGELELQHEMAPDKYPMATGIRSQQQTPQSDAQQVNYSDAPFVHVPSRESGVIPVATTSQLSIPASAYLNEEVIVATGIDLSLLGEPQVTGQEIETPRINNNLTTESDISDNSFIIPDIEEIVRSVSEFFDDREELTYEDYLRKSIEYNYLVEGLGVYDYVFYPFWKTIHDFLSGPDPKSKQGLLQTEDENIYFAQIKDGYFYLKDTVTQEIIQTVSLSSVTQVSSPGKNSFSICSKRRWIRYYCPIGDDVQAWIFCIMLYLISEKDNRFDSFAPVRPNVHAYPLVDGEEAYEAIAHAMLQAKDHIFITGWCVSPHIFLVRNRDVKNLISYRLDNILQIVAKRGVMIYCILWHETTLAGMNLNTVLTHKLLQSLHPNIHVILHPPSTPFMWTHHQKSVIVDDVVGFCGGLDLAWGRYDNSNHTLIDNNQLMMTWPGNDYYNGAVNRCVVCKNKTDSFRDGFDRDRYPRLPWHDIHCVVTGALARDLASNFIGRWNHHNLSPLTLKIGNDEEEILSLRGGLTDNTNRLKLYHSYLPSWINLVNVKGQVIRSISSWSGSMRTEQSIHNGFIRLIQQAQYYIYIENQYFCSHTELSHKNQNLVAAALIERISKAITNNEVFRVYVVIPMHPDGDPLDSSIQQIIKYQNRTIRGIYDTLTSQHPDSNPENYISFFSLCNYGYLNGVAHYNQIYVHSKLMIIDDKITMIGSANINDRSLNGDRDSEIAVVIEDTENTQTIINGRIRRTGKFAKNLRKKLWREHTGWNPKETEDKRLQTNNPAVNPVESINRAPMSPTTLRNFIHGSIIHNKPSMKERIQNQRRMIGQNVNEALLKDPVSDVVYNSFRRRAAKNTRIYEQVFAHYPGEKHPTIADYKRALELFDETVVANQRGETIPINLNEQLLPNIKGHLVEYPLLWLNQDPFKKDIKLKVLDTSVFY